MLLAETFILIDEETFLKMPYQTKVSVVVTFYNQEKFVRKALDSVINQTLQEIEIICVDDGSFDSTRTIIEEYAQADRRIMLICHNKNLGTSQARKDGVLASTGEYVMFLDGDDQFKLNACEVAYNAITSAQTDIVHFGMVIINCTGRENAGKGVKDFVHPFLGRIEGDLLKAVWNDKKFNFTLLNKIYRGNLAHKAFAEVEDGPLTYAEDLYAFFHIAYFANSYYGIEEELYVYNYGQGFSGHINLKLEYYKNYLQEGKVLKALNRFAVTHNLNENHRKIIMQIAQYFISECTTRWLNEIAAQDRSAAFDELVKAFDIEDVICFLARKHWQPSTAFCEKLIELQQFAHTPRSANLKITIGIYYWRIANGGTEHVCTMLCNRFVELKDKNGNDMYNVIMITDTELLPKEYPLSPKVKRVFLPAYANTAAKEHYQQRYRAWQTIIETYSIDIIIHAQYRRYIRNFWDMIAIKSAPSHPAFICQYNSFCGLPFRESNNVSSWMPYVYRMSDGIVALSECDQEFFSAFNPNTRFIVNPFEFVPQDTPCSDYEKNIILWTGRISEEKNPLDVLKVLELIRAEIPNIMLYIVGGENAKIVAQMEQYVKEHNLGPNVHMTGYVLDTAQYYSKASCFLMTSAFEGFSLTMVEALSHGVPIVSYDLPYLTLIRDGRGIITVPQRDCAMMASEVVKLLRAPERIRTLGKQGKQLVTELANKDIMSEWADLFHTVSISDGSVAKLRTDNAAILYKYITQYQQIGRDAATQGVRNQAQKNEDKLIKELEKVKQDIILIEAERNQAQQAVATAQKICDLAQQSVFAAQKACDLAEQSAIAAHKECDLAQKVAVDAQKERDQAQKAVINAQESLISERIKLQLLTNKLNSVSHQLYCNERSISFKIGRVITWLPRKVRESIRCYSDHGLRYTLKHVVSKHQQKDTKFNK